MAPRHGANRLGFSTLLFAHPNISRVHILRVKNIHDLPDN